MNHKILYEFLKLYNYQDTLSKMINGDLNQEYSLTEIHCIAQIGLDSQLNGIKLSQKMNITRGAVSKITQRLQSKKLIEGFYYPENKKEKYFRLTEAGIDLYKRHEIAHRKWEERDEKFLETIDPQEREIVLSFLTSFNQYLEQIIQEETMNDN